MPSNATNKFITEKVISIGLGILGSVITAILLWIGSTVQQMQIDMSTVVQKMDQQNGINSQLRSSIDLHQIRLDTLDRKVLKIELKLQ